MNRVCRVVAAAALAVCVGFPDPAAAQSGQQAPSSSQDKPAPPPAEKPTQPPPAPPEPQEEPPRYDETVVVTGSRAEEKLIDAPATMSVITPEMIELAPSQNFAELLRQIPGVNITQVSARDINITTRAATGTLATGQLAMLDGRSLYQDFFGFVMWDFLPVNFNEVKQIEVIRGPASAVWGANALYGVVNVISKTPREMQGASATLGFGGFDRPDADAGSLWYLSGTWADAPNDRWSYKLSAGGLSQDALARPTGRIPCDIPEVCTVPTTNYPSFSNQGTTQPKFDARVDYDYPDGRKLSFSGGLAGTDGIMHSGIGPFDIAGGSVMGYTKASFTKGNLRAGFFANVLNGDADQLLTVGLNGAPIRFTFDTTTVDFDLSNLQTFAQRHVVSYGGNLRFNGSDLSIAPGADNRTEFGIYAQDEIFLSDMFRWVIGGRVDRFDYINDFVFSPRTTFLIKPREAHTFRVSYNRAYRSPSVINNHIDLVISEPIDLRPLNPMLPFPYLLPVAIEGNPDLQEQSLDAFELGYSGTVLEGRAILSAAYYMNWVRDDILFTQDGVYTVANPPANWPLPPIVIGLLAQQGRLLPSRFTYKNFGKSTTQGFELGVNAFVNQYVSLFGNYSFQTDPDPKDFPLTELNLPPNNRFNLGANFNYRKFQGNLSVAYTDDAFWQDVLNDPYHGTTDAYTIVNAGFGYTWADDRITTSVKFVNLGNSDVLQHVFGDITKRQVVGEVKLNLPRVR
ncbi:MAG TPA: TonB-dependent receptor [Vicinamibacterales bacterium]|nr:TonB-dependent receptor [Vicinamibacterales bacterium]